MWLNMIETKNSRLLERAMDVTMLRSEMLAQNIANVNTPGYKRMDVDFAAVLDLAVSRNSLPMATTHSQHVKSQPLVLQPPMVFQETATTSRYDRNNVDPEFEMAQISENSMFYQSLASSWRGQMNRLKMVIEGRI